MALIVCNSKKVYVAAGSVLIKGLHHADPTSFSSLPCRVMHTTPLLIMSIQFVHLAHLL